MPCYLKQPSLVALWRWGTESEQMLSETLTICMCHLLLSLLDMLGKTELIQEAGVEKPTMFR